jgi:hypothetical protein
MAIDPTMPIRTYSKNVRGKSGKRKRLASLQNNEETELEPQRKLTKNDQSADVSLGSSTAGDCPSQESPPEVENVQLTNRGDYTLYPGTHADDVHGGAHEIEQVAGPSVDEGRHENSCPLCLEDFTTQRLATPDTCDHTFCAVCLHEWSKKENKCPADQKIFNFINIRHCRDGEIITSIAAEPSKQQSDCDREDKKLPCCKYTLGHGMRPAVITTCMLILCWAAEALSFYFSQSSMQ